MADQPTYHISGSMCTAGTNARPLLPTVKAGDFVPCWACDGNGWRLRSTTVGVTVCDACAGTRFVEVKA